MKSKLFKSVQEISHLKFKKISKTEAQEKVRDFFSHIKHKTSDEVRKIKKLSMKHGIKLGDKRKLFCKKCLNPYEKPSVSFKNDFITIECEKCDYKNRWKFKEIDFQIEDHEKGKECC